MEDKVIGKAVITVDLDTSAAMEKLDELGNRVKDASFACPHDDKPLSYGDVQQAMWRFAVRISEKEDATPDELEAMTRVACL